MAEGKQYVSDNPDLMEEWDWERNSTIEPNKLSVGSGRKVWWVCKKCGNHWEANASNRIRHASGCPYCAGKLPIKGQTDLASQFPHIAEQWDFEKNGDLLPCDIMPKSNKKVWWKCEKGHSWNATIANRTSNHGCPYCAGMLSIRGETDLESQFLHLAKQWDYCKNGELLPCNVTAHSNKKVWWLCERGHSWQASINHRSNGHGCPTCAQHLQRSFPETAIYYYISKFYEDTVQSYASSGLGKFELDVYIPSRKIAIEYDGKAYHSTEQSLDRELRKYILANEQNIYLNRIREGIGGSQNCDAVIPTTLGELNISTILYNAELARVVNRLFELLGIDDIVTGKTIAEDSFVITSLLYRNSSQNWHSNSIADEWDYEKNAPLEPQMLSIGSNQKVYWKCEKGHSWKASIKERMGKDLRKGTACPYCAGNKVWKGFNDFASQFPDLLKEWDFSRNTILPDNISRGYNGKIWWKCKNGHRWQARISSRINLHTGCPYCSNRKVLPGYNDLETVSPILAAEWHPERNGNLTPRDVVAGSHKRVWWICKSCGYSWEAVIRERAKGSRCPKCSK